MGNGEIYAPPFKSSFLYQILHEFQKHVDQNGGFEYVDRFDVLKELVSQGVIEKEKEPYYHRAVTTLSTLYYHKSTNVGPDNWTLLHHDNGSMHKITDLGYLVYLSWEKDYGERAQFEINYTNKDLSIEKPCKIFISCGFRDSEKEFGDFLYDKLESNKVSVFWWGKKNPSQVRREDAWDQFRSEIEKCDYFVAMLHRRERLGFQRYHTSTAVRDEITWAIQNDKPKSIFKEKDVVIDGMIIPREVYRPVTDSTELLRILQEDINKWQETLD